MKTTTPPGFENIVTALKGKVESPYAVAWRMYNRGYVPGTKEGLRYHPEAMYKRLQYDEAKSQYQTEAKDAHNLSPIAHIGENATSSLGYLTRKGVREANSLRGNAMFQEFRTVRVLREADTPVGETVPVLIIAEGPGNRRDRNFYPGDALKRSSSVFDGVKCFLDHPGLDEEENRPERSVKDIAGWFSDTKSTVLDGKVGIVGDLSFSDNDAGRQARELLESDARYRKKHPDKVLVGFSINGEGAWHDEEIEGEPWHMVDSIDRAMSCDIVTFPARDGRALGFLEAEDVFRSWSWRRAFSDFVRNA